MPIFLLAINLLNLVPQLKAAKKDLKQTKKRNVENSRRKKQYKKVLREIDDMVKAGKIDDAKVLLPKAYKALDKASKKNTIHKNTAGRYKSRITKLVNNNVKEKTSRTTKTKIIKKS